MDDLFYRGEPRDAVPVYRAPLNVPVCSVCEARAFMGINPGRRYCVEHMPGIEEEFREELRKVLARR